MESRSRHRASKRKAAVERRSAGKGEAEAKKATELKDSEMKAEAGTEPAKG